MTQPLVGDPAAALIYEPGPKAVARSGVTASAVTVRFGSQGKDEANDAFDSCHCR